MKCLNCQKKQKQLKQQFLALSTLEERFEKCIAMGRALPPFPEEKRQKEYRVHGCQSTLYLVITLDQGKMHISASSDSLISSGLAALLIAIYENEPPETLFQCPPLFLKEIGVLDNLSPMRSNGLHSLYKKMQEDVLKLGVVIG